MVVDSDYNFSLEKINSSKVCKTVRGSIKKAIFYLGLNLPYSQTENLVIMQNSINELFQMTSLNEGLLEIFIADAKIRYCDDILDNVLAKIDPIPICQMRKVVEDFERDMNYDPGEVANLFKKEIDLLQNEKDYNPELIKEKIRDIIQIRPCDYFLLVEKLIKKFGTILNETDYTNSLNFFKDFQRLRDLLDDMMSIEEDILKKDYISQVIQRLNFWVDRSCSVDNG